MYAISDEIRCYFEAKNQIVSLEMSEEPFSYCFCYTFFAPFTTYYINFAADFAKAQSLGQKRKKQA